MKRFQFHTLQELLDRLKDMGDTGELDAKPEAYDAYTLDVWVDPADNRLRFTFIGRDHDD